MEELKIEMEEYTIWPTDIIDKLIRHPEAMVLFSYCSTEKEEYLENKKKKDIMKELSFSDRKWRKAYKKLNELEILKLKPIFKDGKLCGTDYVFSGFKAENEEIYNEAIKSFKSQPPKILNL